MVSKISFAFVLGLSLVGSCKQPGQGSTIATVGPAQPSQPAPSPAPSPPAQAASEVTWLSGCRAPIEQAQQSIASLLAVEGMRDAANTLEPFNDACRYLTNAGQWAHLQAAVNPSASIRDAARACEQEVQKVQSALLLDGRVHAAIQRVDVSLADATTKRFVLQTLGDYRRAGVELDDAARARMAQIEEELTALGQAFYKNVNEDVRSIEITDPAKLAGLPADWIAAHGADASGTIRVTTEYPDYIPFLTYAHDDALRKALYIANKRRAETSNEPLLRKVLALREEKAHLLGFKDWADYQSDDKMVRGGKAAQDFLARIDKLAAKRARQDYAELLAQLRTTDEAAQQVMAWQRPYLETIPKELVEKMRRADGFGRGTWTAFELFYSALSLQLHQQSPATLDLLELEQALYKKHVRFPAVEGARWSASFGHLIGYSSMYYTYLWSMVIARDLLTPFEKKGLMARDVASAYRDKILVAGGSKDAAELVRDFLGRPYDFRAYERYLSEAR